MEKKKMGRSVKIGLAAAIAVLIAGVSIYATSAPASESITESEAKQIALAEVNGADADETSSEPSGISLEEAKSIALSQVSGASSGNIIKAEKDYDDGRAEYEIEIEYNGYEYEFEISATSGNILSKDVDRDDD